LLGISALPPITAHATETVPKEVYQRVVRAHNGYFQLREMGDYEKAYTLFTDGQKSHVSLAQFSSQWAAVRERYGRLTRLTMTKVTWYRNPAGSSGSLYAAIDFRASFERLEDFCGFVVWSIGDGYKVQREEMNFFVDHSDHAMSDIGTEKAVKTLPCH
jgi:hypothetical protein